MEEAAAAVLMAGTGQTTLLAAFNGSEAALFPLWDAAPPPLVMAGRVPAICAPADGTQAP
jgi:hypothetical protein